MNIRGGGRKIITLHTLINKLNWGKEAILALNPEEGTEKSSHEPNGGDGIFFLMDTQTDALAFYIR